MNDIYDDELKAKMKSFYNSLSEKDKRRYAAIEVEKLPHGGTEYIAEILHVDQKTIRSGLRELQDEEKMNQKKIRKKGAADTAK